MWWCWQFCFMRYKKKKTVTQKDSGLRASQHFFDVTPSKQQCHNPAFSALWMKGRVEATTARPRLTCNSLPVSSAAFESHNHRIITFGKDLWDHQVQPPTHHVNLTPKPGPRGFGSIFSVGHENWEQHHQNQFPTRSEQMSKRDAGAQGLLQLQHHPCGWSHQKESSYFGTTKQTEQPFGTAS